jgi:hypothetical protein
MPRAADGTVTLPVGNPVVAGTAISPTVHNATMADIAAMLEDSLSRSGSGGMQVPLTFQQGSAPSPGVAFDGDPNTGLYDKAADTPAITAGGVEAQEWSTTGTTIPGTLTVTGAATISGGLTLTGQLARSNLPTVGQQVSASSGAFTTASTTPVDVDNLSVTITTTGRPVLVVVQSANEATNGSHFGADSPGHNMVVRILRDGSAIAKYDMCANSTTAGNGVSFPAFLAFLDVGATAAAHTYKVQANTLTSGNALVNYCVLVAYEL